MSKYRISILGASYGSLLASKILSGWPFGKARLPSRGGKPYKLRRVSWFFFPDLRSRGAC